jgi:hypothetical protein
MRPETLVIRKKTAQYSRYISNVILYHFVTSSKFLFSTSFSAFFCTRIFLSAVFLNRITIFPKNTKKNNPIGMQK